MRGFSHIAGAFLIIALGPVVPLDAAEAGHEKVLYDFTGALDGNDPDSRLVMDADGNNKHQVTHNGAANFAPFYHPDGKRIIFASNMANPKSGRDFDLYIVNEDGSGLQRITYYPDFDAFPMFTSDGKRLVWASNRNGKEPHETNIFIADWVP